MIDGLLRDYERARTIVDKKLEEYVRASYDGFLAERIMHAIRGGKRLRGGILYMTAQKGGGDLRKALDFSVAVELAHSASLVHDDIIDGDVERRGFPAFWRKYGIGEAVIVPHIMISDALSIISRYGTLPLRISLWSWKKASQGQLADTSPGKIGWREYWKIVLMKTGTVFASTMFLGVLTITRRRSVLKEAYRYGLRLGCTYQVLDDAVEIFSGGRLEGSSLILGKVVGGNLARIRKLLHYMLGRVLETARRLGMGRLAVFLSEFPLLAIHLVIRENKSRVFQNFLNSIAIDIGSDPL